MSSLLDRTDYKSEFLQLQERFKRLETEVDIRITELEEEIYHLRVGEAAAVVVLEGTELMLQKALARAVEAEQAAACYLHKCRKCNAELPWTDGTDTEYWCQNCGYEQPARCTEVRWESRNAE